MNRKITLTYEEVEYTLEFDRNTIKALERTGFQYEAFMEKPMTNVELAFAAAFIKNHPKVSQTTIDAIYERITNKEGLIGTLSLMINDCYESLLSEPEEDSGNITWEMVDSTPIKKNQK